MEASLILYDYLRNYVRLFFPLKHNVLRLFEEYFFLLDYFLFRLIKHEILSLFLKQYIHYLIRLRLVSNS